MDTRLTVDTLHMASNIAGHHRKYGAPQRRPFSTFSSRNLVYSDVARTELSYLVFNDIHADTKMLRRDNMQGPLIASGGASTTVYFFLNSRNLFGPPNYA